MATLRNDTVIRSADGQGTSAIVTASNIGSYGVATNSTYYVGTTQNIFNRASGAQTLTGVSIDGNAANITAYTINQNVGTANAPSFAGATLTSTLSITGGDGLRAFKAGAATVTSHIYWANTTNTVAYNWQLDENNNAAMWGYTSAWGKLLTVTSAGAFSASGDVRAPIFYDSANTAYYLDPASTSNLVGLTVANTITGSVSGNAATATNVAWTGITGGARTNYLLEFQPPANSYAGFAFKTSAAGEAGYFLVKGTADGDVYTAEGITLVADAGWLTLAQRTTASRGVRIMTGTSSAERLKITTAGDVQIVNGNTFTYNSNVVLHAGNYTSYPDATKLPLAGGTLTGNLTITKASAYLYLNGTNSDSELRFLANSSDRWAMGMNVGDATENLNIYNYTTATTNFTILKASGNVGVGTASPSYKLDVSGAINASTYVYAGVFYDNDNTVYYTNPSGTSNLVGLTVANTIAGSVSGNAATATTSALLTSSDVRTISPSSANASRLTYGFTSYSNNNTGSWADYLHLRSYADSSGGNDNLIMFNKSVIGMRIWQQAFGSATAYATYKDVAFTDQGFYIGTTSVAINRSSASQTLTGVSIDGNAATATNGLTTSNYVSYSAFTGAISSGGAITATSYIYTSTYLQTGGNLIYPSTYGVTQRLEVSNAANNAWIDGLTIAPGGIVTAYGDSRAPIFYDSANTAYYCDPNGVSNLYGVAIRGDVASANTDNQIFFWGTGNSTTSAIGFKSNSGVFPNPTGNGDGYNTYLTMDTDGRGWVFRRGVGGTDFTSAYTAGWILNNGIWQANASMRAPIFYDSNDTTYYLNPADVSYLYEPRMAYRTLIGAQSYDTTLFETPVTTRPGVVVRGIYPHIEMVAAGINNVTHGATLRFVAYDTANATTGDFKHWVIGCGGTNATGLYFGYSPNQTNPHYGIGRGWSTGNDVSIFWILNDREVYAENGVRATIFYDRNDTAYYVDPSSNSILLDVEARGGINLRRDLSAATGISFYNTSYYNWQVYMAPAAATGCGANGNLTAPNGLTNVSSWALRSRMENVGSYGWLWELGGSGGGGPTATSLMELDTGGILTLSGQVRAPIFYDRDNTAYYIDPASTSNLVGLTVANTITGSITGNAGGSSASCTGNAATASNATQFGSEANTNFMRGLAGGTQANLDTYTDNGFRSIAYTGYSRNLLSFNPGGSTGTVQHEYYYNIPSSGWRVRNKTDNTTWSAWGNVVMTDTNQGALTGTIITTNSNTTVSGLNIGGNSGTVGGLSVHSGRNNEVNKVVRTDGNGYIQAGWINTDSGDSGFATRLTRITCSTDNYLRYLGLTDFKVSIGESAKNNYSRRVDYTSDVNYHVGSFGHNGYGANETFHGGSGFIDIWGGTNYPSGLSHIHGFNALHYTVNSLGTTGGAAYGWQMVAQYNSDSGPWWRRCSGGSFSSWLRLVSYGNNQSGTIYASDFYDNDNTAYYINPASASSLNTLTMAGIITTVSTGTAINFSGQSDSIGYNATAGQGTYIKGTGSTYVYGGGTFYDGTAVRTLLHSNNYNSYSPTLTGTGASGTWSINVTGNAGGSSASCTGNSATTTLATKATRANGNFYIDDNYGNTVVGLYSATRLQGVFAMGDSYKLTADGTGVGTLYGLAWSHPNFGGVAANLADHGLLILQNGVFKGAWGGGSLRTPGDVRGTLFYDWDNTGYYCDPASTSNLNAITAAGNITAAQYYTANWFRSTTSGNGLYNEATTQHFYSDSINYWNVASSSSSQGIRFRTGGHAGTVRGYIIADTNNDVGLLNQDGNWRVRVVGGDYTIFDGSSIRAQIFYDSNDTGYYTDPAGTSILNVVRANSYVQKSASQSLSGTVGCTIDVAAAGIHVLTLAASTTISSFTYNYRAPNPSVNTIMLVIKYGGTASITWTNVLWANGVTPTITGVSGYADVYMLTSYQGTTGVWIGTVVSQGVVSTSL